MSVTHLEDFVQMMVKPSSAGLSDAAAKAVDGPKWRETLQRLVSRCYAPRNYRSSKDKPKPRRRDSSASRARSGELTCSRFNKISYTNAIELANSVVSEYSPVVSLCDVLKFKPNEQSPDPTPKQVQQDEFLQYFGLNLNNNLNGNTQNEPYNHKYVSHHPRNLINTPQVPFSSDLGIKLIMDRPEIPREIHERKLERLGRYLQDIPNSEDVQYEVTYNKTENLDASHFYTFPSRNFHDKNKLTPKARYLLKKYCKPCSVSLLQLDTETLNPVPQRLVDQKENIHLSKNKVIHSENRVALIDNFLNPSSKTLPVRSANFLTNKSISKNSDNESRRTRQQNISKTLTPRNENTMDIKKGTNDKNLVNVCVVLQPINKLIERVRSDNGEENQKNLVKGRIKKKRVNTYYPRRVSPRLQIDNKPLIL